MSKNSHSFINILLDFFEITLIWVVVFIVVYLFIGQLLEVSGDSMYPTIKNKEQLIAEKLSIKYKELERGEIVIIKHPKETGRLLVKRVIGLPGETIRLENGTIYANGVLIEEPYIKTNTQTVGSEAIRDNTDYEVANDAYIVMGDNREKSTDSRYWGAVQKNLIVGRALLVYHPFKDFRFLANNREND